MSLPADLRRPLRATSRRIRAQRAMDAGAVLALAGLGLAAVLVAFVKTGALADARAMPWLAVALALPIAGALFGALRPVAPLLPAKLLDRAHGLHDRVTNAVSFSALPERTPFMIAAIDDALAHAKALSAKRAMPLRVPFDVVPAAGLAVGVIVLAILEVPRVAVDRTVHRGIDPVTLHEDDLDAYDSGLRELLEDPNTPDDVRGVAREFNRLIEDLADERLDRAESLRRITELEEQLANARPGDAEELRESLEQLGQSLERSELSRELSEALREGDAERAEAEMRELAERMRQEEPNRAELERLRQALARAAEQRREDCTAEIRELERSLAAMRSEANTDADRRTIARREQELEERRSECQEHANAERQQELQRLLQRQREQQQQSQQDRRLLERRQRELDQLRRESQQTQEQRRQLERLQRELERAAQELNQGEQDQEQSAEHMEQGAEELNRMAQEQMSEEEMQRLQQQLAELRELIRRSRQQQQQAGRGQNGQGQSGQSRMDRFVARARGQNGQGIPLGMPGQQGGQQSGAQQGQNGEGQQGQEGQQQMMLTPGGQGGNAMVEIPGMGGQQQQQGQGPGGGRAQQGPGAGVGHDDTMLDDPSLLGGERQTVRVEGEQGDGPVRSDVEINRGAQRGFASRRYRDVYTRYEGHAEEVLERDQVPQGYRFYVRRYFQLIRPRTE